MFRKLYLSPFGILISLILNILALLKKPFMVYGFYNRKNNKFNKKTRISSSAVLVNKKNIDIEDMVWIGHYCILDGIGGIKIGKGVQIASHSCIYTHSSQNAIRILGEKYIDIPAENREAYIIDNVEIGDFTFIGTSSIILAGSKIGKGCIIGAGSIVSGIFPDYSVILGNPAKIKADTRNIDKRLLANIKNKANYYNPEFINNQA